MDIKDFILFSGGVLIALVVGHGFWIAWRAKREPLRLDIVPDLISDDVDEIERLRGELPNGGARVVNRSSAPPAQENMELDLPAPVLMDPARAAQEVLENDGVLSTRDTSVEPGRDAPTVSPPAARSAPFDGPKKLRAGMHKAANTEDLDAQGDAEHRPEVREVDLGLQPILSEAPVGGAHRAAGLDAGELRAEQHSSTEPVVVEELLVVNVLAPRGGFFAGESLVEALRNQGLRYGDMNIFHRIDPATKAHLYSIANAVEPGTFDLSDLSSLQSPGMTFFLQLPAPGSAVDVFEDMLQAARSVAVELGGELRDEDLSVLTGQTMEHMRQRIADFARRRLSKRA